MKNKIIFALALSILILNIVSAVQVQQTRILKINNTDTTQNHASILFADDGFTTDYTSGHPYEFYINYQVAIENWNTQNPSYNISYCNLSIDYYSFKEQKDTILFNQTFDGTNDVPNGQYFIILNKKDEATVDAYCVYNKNRSIEMPIDFQVIAPTKYCKACQYYQWSLQFISEQKISSLSNYNSENVGYIKSLVEANYGLLIVIFWVVLILVVLSAIGLIFYGIFWLYKWLRSVIK